MRTTIIFSLIFCGLILVSCSGRKNWYKQVESKSYAAILDSLPNPHIIDVRTPGEYGKGHIAGATNLNFLDSQFKEEIQKLDTDRPIVIYCATAHRSPLAAKKLKKVGFPMIIDLKGGFNKWSKAGMPVEVVPE